MVSQITLGNITQQNGRNVVGGSQSGLDTEGLIKALTDAKRLPAVALETKNKTISTQKTALASLQSLLGRFKSAVDTLRNPPGVGTASKNIFEYRSATLSSTNGTASSYMDVTVLPGASIQNFTINEIEQLARETKQESNVYTLPSPSGAIVTAANAPEAGKFSAGTFTLRAVDGGANPSITFAENDSLQTVASKFNDVKNRTGIQATVIKVGTGSPDSTYKMIFTSTKTGLDYGFNLGNVGTVVTDPDGVFAQSSFNTTQPAQNAKFTLDGVPIERQVNSMNDVITGINFTLKQATPPATEMTLSIAPDTEIVKNAVLQFVDVYNEFRLFAGKQQELGDDGLPTEDAVLASNTALRSAINLIGTEVTRMVQGIAGASEPKLLTDIGISFDNFIGDEENPAAKNIMVVDAEKLASMLAANFDGVRKVFEFQMTADNTNLLNFSRSNELAASSLTLNINRVTNTYQATYINSSNATVTVDLDMVDNGTSGITLRGKSGTGLSGLELIFADTGNATINVKFSQGFGDRLFNVMDGMLKTDGGILTTAATELVDQTERNETEITKIDDFITKYRDQLIDQYSRLESALTKANQLLSLLDAQASARESA